MQAFCSERKKKERMKRVKSEIDLKVLSISMSILHNIVCFLKE